MPNKKSWESIPIKRHLFCNIVSKHGCLGKLLVQHLDIYRALHFTHNGFVDDSYQPCLKSGITVFMLFDKNNRKILLTRQHLSPEHILHHGKL